MRCAVRATGCVIGNLGFAVRAQTWLRCRLRFRSELVDLTNHHKDDKSENQKIQYGINEAAIGKYRSSGLFCCFQCSIFLAVEADKQIGKSILPSAIPNGGITTSFTSELTILPKAPPMITPTAISITLPRIANFLKSSFIDIYEHPSLKVFFIVFSLNAKNPAA